MKASIVSKQDQSLKWEKICTLTWSSVIWVNSLEFSASSLSSCSFCLLDTARVVLYSISISVAFSGLSVVPFVDGPSSRFVEESPDLWGPRMCCFSSLATVRLLARSIFFSATIYLNDAASRRSSSCCFSAIAFSMATLTAFSSASFFASWDCKLVISGVALAALERRRDIEPLISLARSCKCFSNASWPLKSNDVWYVGFSEKTC